MRPALLRPLLLATALALPIGCEGLRPEPGTGDPASDGGPPVPDDSVGGADGGTPGTPHPDGGTVVNAPRFELYIRPQPYPRLVLEVDGLGGYRPTPEVLTRLEEGLRDVLGKQVEVRVDEALPGRGASHAWSDEELFQLARSTFNLRVEADSLKMHVLLVDGHSDRDTASGRVLGLAFPWTHLVLFRQTIDRVCGRGLVLNEPTCQDAEFGVWAHEVGHQLGLVDNGLPMVSDHKDHAHGAHDRSDACIMYWAYSGSSILEAVGRGVFGDAPKLGLDAACLADIEAVRNRP